MKKWLYLITVALFLSFTLLQTVWAVGRRNNTPLVRYLEPKNDSTVDLKGKENMVFQWKKMPIPGGGRAKYKFELYDGFGYERIVSEDLKHDVYSIEVPADKFENGKLYTWQVKQRDATTRIWSRDDRWSFKVKK